MARGLSICFGLCRLVTREPACLGGCLYSSGLSASAGFGFALDRLHHLCGDDSLSRVCDGKDDGPNFLEGLFLVWGQVVDMACTRWCDDVALCHDELS